MAGDATGVKFDQSFQFDAVRYESRDVARQRRSMGCGHVVEMPWRRAAFAEIGHIGVAAFYEIHQPRWVTATVPCESGLGNAGFECPQRHEVFRCQPAAALMAKNRCMRVLREMVRAP